MSACSLSLQAEIDLTEILEYIAADNLDAAVSMHQVFLDCFDLLARSPKGGRPRDDLEPGLRSHPTGSYIIFYRMEGKQIYIARVLLATSTRSLAEPDRDP